MRRGNQARNETHIDKYMSYDDFLSIICPVAIETNWYPVSYCTYFKTIHLLRTTIQTGRFHIFVLYLYCSIYLDCISGECAVPGLNATFSFLWFTNCVLLFDKSLILRCLWPLVFVINNTLILGIWCFTIPHLPGCFCPWTVNTVLTDPVMSHLATQLGYSAGEFQALQLIVLAAFGVVD